MKIPSKIFTQNSFHMEVRILWFYSHVSCVVVFVFAVDVGLTFTAASFCHPPLSLCLDDGFRVNNAE